jgi:hypothetical protein
MLTESPTSSTFASDALIVDAAGPGPQQHRFDDFTELYPQPLAVTFGGEQP